MKQILWALFFGAFFAVIGFAAVNGNIPPLDLLGEPTAPIACGVVGLAVGLWLGNR
jgi:hypothetical protein